MEVVREPEIADYTIANVGPWTVLRFSLWPEFSVGQTTSLTGSDRSGFSSPRERNYFLTQFEYPYHEAEQVHGSEVREVRRRSACYLDTDGLVSPGTNQLLTIQTADCVPVYVRGAHSTRYALLHVGWRGLVKGIVPRALAEYFKGSVEVLLGSGIHQEHYEVGEEVVTALCECFECTEERLLEVGILDDRTQLDLYKAILHQFADVNVECSRIQRVPLDTASQQGIPLPSYRRDKTDARIISWMVLKGNG